MSKRGYLPDEVEQPDETEPAAKPSRVRERPHKHWHTAVAMLICAILGAALAFGFVTFAKSSGTAKFAPPSPAPSPVETIATPSAGPSTISKPPASESPSLEHSAADKRNIRVWVFNASGRTGWAREVANKLQGAGFVNPLADNSATKGLHESTVIYRDNQFAAAAKEAARIAGVTNVQNAADGKYLIGDTDIEIYLIN